MDFLGLFRGLYEILYIKFGIVWNVYDGYLIVDFYVKCILGVYDIRNSVRCRM